MAIRVGVYEAPGKQTIEITYVAGPLAIYRAGGARQRVTLLQVLAADLQGYRRR